MGPLTPYLIAGVDLARPTAFANGALSPLDAVNNVFSGPGAVQAVGTVGMGVTYQITPNFSMGIEGRMYRPTSQQRARALAVLSPPRLLLSSRRSGTPGRVVPLPPNDPS